MAEESHSTKPNRTWMKGAPKEESRIAFCRYSKHFGNLSENLLKQHKCLEKQCPYLKKYEEKGFWIKRKITNALKKKNKKGYGFIVINDDRYATDDFETLYRVAVKEVELTGGQPPLIEYDDGRKKNTVEMEDILK